VALAIGHVTGPMAMAGPRRDTVAATTTGQGTTRTTGHAEGSDHQRLLRRQVRTPHTLQTRPSDKCAAAQEAMSALATAWRNALLSAPRRDEDVEHRTWRGGTEAQTKSAARVGAAAPSARDRLWWSDCRTFVCADVWRVGDEPPAHPRLGPHHVMMRAGALDWSTGGLAREIWHRPPTCTERWSQ